MNVQNLEKYELIQQKNLEDLQTEGYLLKHRKSGARVLLMENRDENKVFTIGFRTPPEDSSGLPHILEHSVLCGSKNFPAKDPFVELVKGSLNTFLNAMTYPDKTLYPAASCNDKDFQNLMHVYMDAVFYPNIYKTDKIFKQEGWSYQLESPEGELEYNGVVYNEMKGAFSSPEGVLDRVILNSLFPDTSYANESGGDPDVIPDLTYEDFILFHQKYYHPSNSYIYLYGDMDMEEKLAWLDEKYLSDFDAIKIDSEIKKQKPFEKVAEVTLEYSIAEDEKEEDNTYLSYNKVVGENLDKELYQAFQILDYVLLSAPGATIKKALLDAGIGKDIMGSYDNGIIQPIFSIVAKNANADQKDSFVKVIEDTLKDIVSKGIDEKAIAAAINYHEFRYREADFGSYPKGLMYGLEMYGSWIYEETAPFVHIEQIETFELLKKQNGTGYYEDLIEKWLLNNCHGSLVMVVPEKGRTARLEEEQKRKLKEYKSKLDKESIQKLVNETAGLKAYQEDGSSEEDLKKIPVLQRDDLSKEIEPIANCEMDMHGVPVIYHEIETNGIGYVDVLFDISGIPTEWLPYVGILQGMLGIVDTQNFKYGELFDEINVHTGGIGTSLELYPDVTRVKEKKYKATFEMKTKALYHKLPIAFEMMEEILVKSQFTDEKRLGEILDQIKSKMQMRFQSAGHTTAILRAQSYASPMSKLKDMTAGIEFYETVRFISENFEQEKEKLIERLQILCRRLFARGNMTISYTAGSGAKNLIDDAVKKLQSNLFIYEGERFKSKLLPEKHNEGFKTASQVQYVGRAGNFIDRGVEYHGALHILKVILSYEYLWQNIRVKGGAYGCMSGFSRTGEGYFVSYRDPNLKETNEIYEGIVEYLRNFTVNERDMTKYIIGTMSNIDHPMTPAAKGDRSMNIYMNHVSEEMIRKERQEILSATQEDIRGLAKVVQAVLEANQICVVGSEAKIMEQQELFQEIKSLF
ncbi:insulinase family protein [Lachnospiraceae bacterium OttesenSCG-928-E19]|nr:insulinase family protein [Lachnospiraceae bacterium OttesenSCG-928-E19]